MTPEQLDQLLHLANVSRIGRLCSRQTNKEADEMLESYLRSLVQDKPDLISAALAVLSAAARIDDGCREPSGFRGWENGLGEPVGDVLQDALDALNRIVRGVDALPCPTPNPVLHDDEPKVMREQEPIGYEDLETRPRSTPKPLRKLTEEKISEIWTAQFEQYGQMSDSEDWSIFARSIELYLNGEGQ